MAELEVLDFRWLVDDEARRYLERGRDFAGRLVAFAASLRRDLPAERARLVLQQCELRERARRKFSRADEMFFTRPLLEQATDEWIARYKGARSANCGRWLDLCCGLGGDVLGRAAAGGCLAIDRDPIAVLFAKANSRVYGLRAEVAVGDAAAIDNRASDGWHIDPDRRPRGTRTTHLDIFEPGPDVIDQLLSRQPDGCVKLAPATEVPDAWAGRAEREWIESRRECRQQVVWFGRLAQHAGCHRATVVGRDGASRSLAGSGDISPPVTQRVERYIYDPSPAVRAARLAGELARVQGLAAVGWEGGYLTADRPCQSPLIAGFEVLEVLPLDVRRLRGVLRARRVGRLEWKTCGMRVDPARWVKAMKLSGENELTLLLAGPERSPRAILARRRESGP